MTATRGMSTLSKGTSKVFGVPAGPMRSESVLGGCGRRARRRGSATPVGGPAQLQACRARRARPASPPRTGTTAPARCSAASPIRCGSTSRSASASRFSFGRRHATGAASRGRDALQRGGQQLAYALALQLPRSVGDARALDHDAPGLAQHRQSQANRAARETDRRPRARGCARRRARRRTGAARSMRPPRSRSGGRRQSRPCRTSSSIDAAPAHVSTGPRSTSGGANSASTTSNPRPHRNCGDRPPEYGPRFVRLPTAAMPSKLFPKGSGTSCPRLVSRARLLRFSSGDERAVPAMSLWRRSIAELCGTFWLVLGGCGSAVLAAAFPGLGIGFAGVALAFGLSVLTMAYALGPLSGAHFNPAVTVGLCAWAGAFPAEMRRRTSRLRCWARCWQAWCSTASPRARRGSAWLPALPPTATARTRRAATDCGRPRCASWC